MAPGQPYARGAVGRVFVERLVELLADPWQPSIAVGTHHCGFCRLTGGPVLFRLEGQLAGAEIVMGTSNLFVPAEGFLYVAPSLILHYMDAHDYSPPVDFQRAVMACPAMRSMEYLKAVIKNRPQGFAAAAGDSL
ncbi:MAG: hypothetical protein WD403_09320 [Pirellulales bacterium]